MESLVGFRFGRLVVTALAHRRAGGHYHWACRCDCGNEKVVAASSLKREFTRSCGCLNAEVAREQMTKHGHAGAQALSPTYVSWRSMLDRCTNVASAAYVEYGAAGVTVCERWRGNFETFLADMGERPDGTTLDRYPNRHGNYEPGNCRWATAKEQAVNRSSTVMLELDGRSQCVEDWGREYGITGRAIAMRIERGWSVRDAITTPPRRAKNTTP